MGLGKDSGSSSLRLMVDTELSGMLKSSEGSGLSSVLGDPVAKDIIEAYRVFELLIHATPRLYPYE